MSALESLPVIKNQTEFNLACWDELGKDAQVRGWPGKVETDRYGKIIMSYYSEYSHGGKQSDIVILLGRLLPDGKATVECPISTSDGIKVADAAWTSKKRLMQIGGRTALKGAPEICIEVISPSNKRGEIEEKRRLYFEAGAREVWVCDRKGKLHFFVKSKPETGAAASRLCPAFPKAIHW